MPDQLPFRIKRSAVEGKRPADLELGELALNTYDGRLFAKKDTGGVGVGTTVTLLTPWVENIGGGLYYNEGNIGLGTTNPTTKLFVSGDINFTGNLYQNGTIFQSGGGGGGTSSQWITYGAGISTTSNVGIGTINPTTKLQVNGSVTLGAGSTDLISIPGRIASNFYPNGDGVYDIGRPTQIGSGANRWRDANFYGKGSFDGGVDAHDLELGVGSANLIYSTSGNLELNSQSGTTNIDDILTVSGNTGIGTVTPTSKLHVVGDGRFTGIVTASNFVGNLVGIASTATNLSDAANITTGTISSSRLSGSYGISITGTATYASRAGISTNVIGGIASVTSLSVSGITTLGIVTAVTSINFASGGLLGDPYQDGGFGLKSAGGQYKYATIASNNLQQYLQVDDNIIYIGTGYASTTGNYNWVFKKDGSTEFPNSLILAPGSQSITLQSDQYSQLMWMNADQTLGPNKFTNVDFLVASGYATLDIGYRDGASDQQFKSWLWNIDGLQFPDLTLQTTAFTGYAPTAGTATTALGFSTTASINTSGIITATRFVGSLTGTATTATNLADAANITTGTINKDRISTTNALTVLGDLYVSNNISFGGTTTQLNLQQLQIVDADIVLGIGTSFSPTDNTANHGGIAIASTEGTPLVNLNIVPGETNPYTYKKIMWFKGSTIGAGLTDAWLFNYGVGIGSTQVPYGVRLAVGGIQMTDSAITATTFTGSLTGTATTATNLSNAANITTGTISSSRLSGSYGIDITGTATTATNLSNAANITTGTISSSRLAGSYGIDIIGTATTATNLSNAANITTGTISSSRLSGTYGISITGTATTATTALGFSTTASINTSGIITASSFVKSSGTSSQFLKADGSVDSSTYLTTTGSGTALTGIVTSIVAGTNITVSGSTGQVTINASSSSGSSSQWTTYSTGISTTSNVGIGTTNATSALTVTGGGTFTGIVTANTFVGSLTGTATTATTALGFSTTASINTSGIITAFSFIGSLTGTATTATNLSNAANITTGTISSSRLAGSYGIDIIGTATTATNLSNAANITTGTISSSRLSGTYGIDIIGTATTATNLSNAANITTGTISSSRLSGSYGIDITGTATTALGFSTIASINTSGIITASSFAGSGVNLTGIVTSIVAGTGITISGSTGQITISTTGPVRTITSFIATANQTTFSVAYTVGYIDVYLNGSRLNATEYTATDGATVVLSPGATLGDAVDMISYGNPTSSYWNVGTGSSIYTLNNTGIGTTNPTTKLSIGGSFTATDTRIQSVAEKTTIVSGNTVSLVYNSGGGNVAICTNPSGDITLNVTGIPTDSTFDNNSLTFSVISNNTGTARSCTTVNLNGVSRTIKWFGGSLAAAISGVTTTSGYDIYNFTGINTVGSASTTTNYVVLGSVNGGYR
jgi:hypothetical protein